VEVEAKLALLADCLPTSDLPLYLIPKDSMLSGNLDAASCASKILVNKSSVLEPKMPTLRPLRIKKRLGM
jgi:hypothetical protein